MKTISLKLPPQMDKQLTAAARRRRMTKSQLVREALRKSLTEDVAPPGSVLDVAGHLVGCLDFGPGDLAHNKRHLEGLGR